MPTYIDLEAVNLMWETTYRNSYFRGDEVAKINRIRYAEQISKKPIANARDSQNSGFIQDGLPED
jgi:hypothetical protein